jgi:hypothetical protein
MTFRSVAWCLTLPRAPWLQHEYGKNQNTVHSCKLWSIHASAKEYNALPVGLLCLRWGEGCLMWSIFGCETAWERPSIWRSSVASDSPPPLGSILSVVAVPDFPFVTPVFSSWTLTSDLKRRNFKPRFIYKMQETSWHYSMYFRMKFISLIKRPLDPDNSIIYIFPP